MKRTKWIAKLIEKITDGDTPNNYQFYCYGKEVIMTSGTEDYTSVNVKGKNEYGRMDYIMQFSLDFLTYECVIEYMEYPEYLDAVKSALKKLYSHSWLIVDNQEDECDII